MPKRPRTRHLGAVLPSDLVNAFRGLCVQRGMTTKYVLSYWIRGVVEGWMPLPPPPVPPDPEPPDEP